jgi:endonuclease/exonuclease/phosphatase (EEP) superfamily protein YafD
MDAPPSKPRLVTRARWTRRTTLVLGLAAAGLGVAVSLAALGVLPVELSHGVPLAAGLAVAGLAAGLAFRPPLFRRLLLPLLLALEAACVALMWPDIRSAWMLHGAGGRPADGPSFSLVEFNVWDDNADPARTLRWLRAANADIIVLAEAREPFIADLGKAFPDYPTFVTCSNRPYCGVVILSRFKGRLLDGGWWIADGLNHPFGSLDHMALAAVELDVPGAAGGMTPTPVIAVHLDRRGLSGVSNSQSLDLLAAVGRASGRRAAGLILAGDFNTSPWSPQMRMLDEALRRTAGARRISVFAPTWPSGSAFGALLSPPPFLAIDHVYLGCEWVSQRLAVGPDAGSDHRSLIARFAAVSADVGCAARSLASGQ